MKLNIKLIECYKCYSIIQPDCSFLDFKKDYYKITKEHKIKGVYNNLDIFIKYFNTNKKYSNESK